MDQKRLRSIKAQVVIKATLFLTVMYLILETINYYYYYTENFDSEIDSVLWEICSQEFCFGHSFVF